MADYTESPAPGIEIRYYDDELDEVVVKDATLVHLEEMDHGQWWLGITTKDGQVDVNLGAVNTRAAKYANAEWVESAPSRPCAPRGDENGAGGV